MVSGDWDLHSRRQNYEKWQPGNFNVNSPLIFCVSVAVQGQDRHFKTAQIIKCTFQVITSASIEKLLSQNKRKRGVALQSCFALTFAGYLPWAPLAETHSCQYPSPNLAATAAPH